MIRTLGDCADVLAGFAWKSKQFSDKKPGIPIIRIQNLGGNENEYFVFWRDEYDDRYVVDDGDLLLSLSGSFKAKIWDGGHALLNQRIVKISPRKDIQKDWLFFALRHSIRRISAMGRKLAISNVSMGDLKKLPLSPPTLEEQRRIVDILNHAANIRRLREEAQKKAREIIPALFVEMFGDPATNPKGWDTAKLGGLGTLDRGKSKHRPRNDPVLLGGPYPLIQTGDVSNADSVLRSFSSTYSEVGLAQSKMWKAGTLCITIAANIAETAVLEFDACFPDSVVGFVAGERVITTYVQTFMEFLQPYLERNAPQAAQKNINLRILREIAVPVPPIERQSAFDERVSEVRSVASQSYSASACADRLAASLLSQAFT